MSCSPRRSPIARWPTWFRNTTFRRCARAFRRAKRCRCPVWETWFDRTGIKILDGIGSTEMLHIFVGSPEEKVVGGSTGLVVPGYAAQIHDESGAPRRRQYRWAPCGKRADGLPLPGRRPPAELRRRRLELSRRRVSPRRARLFLVRGAHGRHDHRRGLQRLGTRGRTGAAHAPGRKRVRGRRQAGSARSRRTS